MAPQNISADPPSIPQPESDTTQSSPIQMAQHEETAANSDDYLNGLAVSEQVP